MYLIINFLLISLVSGQVFALSLIDLTGGATPTDLVSELIDTSTSNITYSNVTYTGANSAAGIFTGGIAEGVGIERGIILSTGRAINAIGPNKCYKTETEFRLPGTTEMKYSFDASILEFDFVPSGDKLEFQYVFASEEYQEFVGDIYNDSFKFFLDGRNIALIPDTTTEVTINSVNYLANTNYYRDNAYPTPMVNNPPTGKDWYFYDITSCKGDKTTPYQTEFDGLTVVLTAKTTVVPGRTYHMKLVIADKMDCRLDSGVFIQGKSFKSPPPSPPPPPEPPSPPPQVIMEVPTLISPTGTITITSPTYIWNAVPNATKYKIKVTGSAGNLLEQEYLASEANCASGKETCSVTPALTLAEGDYQWSIQAYASQQAGPVSAPYLFKVQLPPPPVIINRLYGIQDNHLNDSQFVEIDLDTKTVQPLGELYEERDLEALTVHPATKELYAAAGKDAKTGGVGALYRVNKTDGSLTEVGRLRLADDEPINDVSDISFNPETNMLWGWFPGRGLFKVDISNFPEATAELKWSSKDKIEALTWDKTGKVIYLANLDHLRAYDGLNNPVPVCSIQQQKIEALHATSDTSLLVGIHGQKAIYRLDLTKQQADSPCVMESFVNVPNDDDIEGLAWVTTIK